MHVIKLNGYNATTENGEKLELGTFDSYGEEQLQIVEAPDWANLSVIATFNPPNKKPVQVAVDSITGVIKVPKEATADLYGVGTIVFVGIADGVQRISADCEYIVRKHSNASGTEPAEPTPDLLQQVLTLSKDAQTAAKNAEQSAKNAAKDAADTVKPYKEEAVQAATAAALSEKNAAESKATAQDVADSLPEDYTTAVNDIATLKQQVANITPDDSAIGGKPWSSKHIIDMLCPPLEESGNPVVCYPVAGYPLGVKAKWEPVQEGSGDPSPDNIRPITGRNAVSVARSGKNKVNIPDFTLSVDTNNRTKRVNVNIPAGTYTLSLIHTKNTSGFIVQLHTKNDKLIFGTFPNTFTLENDATYMYFYIKNEEGNLDNISNIQLELGSTATPYEPYTGSTTSISLSETVYGGEVDAVTGSAMRTWEYLTLTADMNWGYDEKNNTITCPLSQKDYAEHAKGQCSHLRYRYDFALGSIFVAFRHITLGRNETKKWTVETWKDYLAAQNAAGTPVQVAYKLAAPVPFTTTGAKPLPAIAGVNTVLTDADSATVTGRADPIKRITDLEDAVASQT